MPSLGQAAALLAEGAIGTPRRIENLFSGVLDVRADWRARPEQGGGVWMDNGPHSLDVLTALGGAPRRIRMTSQDRAQGTPVEDAVAVELEMEHGFPATIGLTWNEAVRAPIARIVGTGGEIHVDWGALKVLRNGDEEVAGGGYDKVGCFRAVHDRFVAAIEEKAGTPAAADPHGLEILRAVEAGYRSAAAGGAWQEL